jgi:enoyl-CoA hydratase/carnithine racemase
VTYRDGCTKSAQGGTLHCALRMAAGNVSRRTAPSQLLEAAHRTARRMAEATKGLLQVSRSSSKQWYCRPCLQRGQPDNAQQQRGEAKALQAAGGIEEPRARLHRRRVEPPMHRLVTDSHYYL